MSRAVAPRPHSIPTRHEDDDPDAVKRIAHEIFTETRADGSVRAYQRDVPVDAVAETHAKAIAKFAERVDELRNKNPPDDGAGE